MSSSRKSALTQAVVFLAVFLTLAPFAHACSCAYFPDCGFIGPPAGRLPANAAGVAWYGPVLEPPEVLDERFSAEILERGEFRALSVEVNPVEEFSTAREGVFVVAPKGDGLKPGATYRFTVDRTDPIGCGHKQVLVTVDDETLQAGTSFTLDVGPAAHEAIPIAAAVTCSETLEVSQVAIRASLARNAQPWREQLLYRTVINGEVHWHPTNNMCHEIVSGRSWESVGHDRVFAVCGEVPSPHVIPLLLKPRRHTVTMQAFLPGAGVVLETPIESVEFRCP